MSRPSLFKGARKSMLCLKRSNGQLVKGIGSRGSITAISSGSIKWSASINCVSHFHSFLWYHVEISCSWLYCLNLSSEGFQWTIFAMDFCSVLFSLDGYYVHLSTSLHLFEFLEWTTRKPLPIRYMTESTVAIDALSALFGSGNFTNVERKIRTK